MGMESKKKQNKRWWKGHFKPMIHPIHRFYSRVNGMRIARRGLFGPFKQTSWTWDSRFAHPSAYATKNGIQHTPEVSLLLLLLLLLPCVFSSNATAAKKNWSWLTSTWKKCLLNEMEMKHFFFFRKTTCKNHAALQNVTLMCNWYELLLIVKSSLKEDAPGM